MVASSIERRGRSNLWLSAHAGWTRHIRLQPWCAMTTSAACCMPHGPCLIAMHTVHSLSLHTGRASDHSPAARLQTTWTSTMQHVILGNFVWSLRVCSSCIQAGALCCEEHACTDEARCTATFVYGGCCAGRSIPMQMEAQVCRCGVVSLLSGALGRSS